MGDFFGMGGGGDSLGSVASQAGGSPGGNQGFNDPMSGAGMPGPGGGDMGFGTGGFGQNAWDTGMGGGTSGASIFTPGGGQAPAATVAQAQQTAPPTPTTPPTGQQSGQSDLMSQIAKILGVNQANAAQGPAIGPNNGGQNNNGPGIGQGFGGGDTSTTAPGWTPPAPKAAAMPSVDDLGRPIPETGGPTAATPPAQAALPPAGQPGVQPPPPAATDQATTVQATPVKTTAVSPDQAPTQPIPGSQPTGPQAATPTPPTKAAPDPATGDTTPPGGAVAPDTGRAGQAGQGFNPMQGILNLIGMGLFGVPLGDLLMGQPPGAFGQPPGGQPQPRTAPIPPQSPPVSGKPQDPAAQGEQPAGPGAANQPTFPNQIPREGQPSAAGIPGPAQGGPLAGAPAGMTGTAWRSSPPVAGNRLYSHEGGTLNAQIARQHASTITNNFGQPFDTNLKSDRAANWAKIQANPWLHERMLRAMKNEQGHNAQGAQAVAETMFNRASMERIPIESNRATGWFTNRGYFDNRKSGPNGPAVSAAERPMLEQALQNAANGSNISNYATDNDSGNWGWNRSHGMFKMRSTYGGEYFSQPNSMGPRGSGHVPDYNNWLTRVQGGGGTAPASVAGLRNQATPEQQAQIARGGGTIGPVAPNVLNRLRNQANVAPQSGQAGGATWTSVPGTPSFPGATAAAAPAAAPGTMTPAEVQRSAGRQIPSWDVPIKPHPQVSPVPEVSGGLTGARPPTELPEITVKPDTAEAKPTAKEDGKDKSKPAPPKTKRKAGMTQTQRRALTRRGGQSPPPRPKLSPYGAEQSSTGYVQPGEPGYERAYRYYYGRNP